MNRGTRRKVLENLKVFMELPKTLEKAAAMLYNGGKLWGEVGYSGVSAPISTPSSDARVGNAAACFSDILSTAWTARDD